MGSRFVIPTEPQIPLQNYLLNLVEKSDRKESSVYLLGVHPFVQEAWNEIIACKEKTIRWKTIIGKLGIHPQGFYAYKNGKKGISVQMLYQILLLWKGYCSKSEAEFNAKWEKLYQSNFYVSGSRRRQVTLPKAIDPKLAYFAGWICGDGSFGGYKNHYLVKISEKSVPQLERVLIPLFQELFGATPKLHRMYGGGYAINLNSKPVFRFLKNVLGLKVGVIPTFVDKLDEVNKRYFLAGIFDSEGYVAKKRYYLTISQAKHNFLLEIQRLLAEVGVVFNGPTTHTTKLGIWYTIYSDKKQEIRNFSELINSCHVEKSQAIQTMLIKMQTV